MTFVRLVYNYTYTCTCQAISPVYVNMCLKHRTKIINFIKGHALIHREFNTCLEKIDPDLIS